MALLSILNREKKFQTKIETLQLDAAISISPTFSAKTTSNPVEDGSEFSDNTTLDPVKLSIEGIVSEAPLELSDSLKNAATGLVGSAIDKVAKDAFGAAGGFVTGAAVAGISGLLNNRDDPTQRPADGYKYLKELWTSRKPFTVVTRLQSFPGMILTSLTTPQSADNGRSLRFTAEFQQIRIVESKTIVLAKVKNESGASTQDRGKQKTKEPKATTEAGSSFAFDAAQGVRSFFGG